MIKFKLLETMQAKGLTPQELVKATGLTRQTVKGLMSGYHARVDLDTLERICKALDVEPGDLLELTPD